METIITSTIGAVAVILAALIPYYLNRKSKSASNENEYLYGEWTCQWWYMNDLRCPDGDMETIMFTSISKNNIVAKGHDKNGTFEMKGQIFENTLSLIGSRPDKSGGEIILTITENKVQLKGIWNWRDDSSSESYGGKTKWTKS